MGVRGWALAEQGQVEEGIAQIRQAKNLLFVPELAAAYAKVGRMEEGLSVVAEALALADKAGTRVDEAELYRVKGQLTLQQFNVQGATFKVTDP